MLDGLLSEMAFSEMKKGGKTVPKSSAHGQEFSSFRFSVFLSDANVLLVAS